MATGIIEKHCIDLSSEYKEKSDASSDDKKKFIPFFIGVPDCFPIPKIIKQSCSDKNSCDLDEEEILLLGFGTEDAPYTAHNDTIQRNVGNIYYDTTVLQLRKVKAVVSRSLNSNNDTFHGHIRLLRSDNLQSIAEIEVTNPELQVVEITSFTNLPITSMTIDVVVWVDDPSTNIQLHSISFYV